MRDQPLESELEMSEATREVRRFEELCSRIGRASGLTGAQLRLLCNRASHELRKFKGDIYEIGVSSDPRPPSGYITTLQAEACGKIVYLHITVD